ncbi:MAG TPA: Gfo/Idh/MocA family oxidoreductase [Isosphaeraceae bacterium]|jgi:predicted dehydrogenase|nr:Gfo/Idh/MocA family oxidoreductase [Isosphaeraceae bacterium]
MPPIRLNRRRFLGCSAAAGLALAQGKVGEAEHGEGKTVRLGLIGLGNRGTTLLRTALELPGAKVVAVADVEPRHRDRAQGIAEKASGSRPEAFESAGKLLERPDVDAVLVALPCDLHAPTAVEAIRAGKHVYLEKPLAPTLAECDLVIAEAARAPDLAVHVGFQRRSNPRYREGVDLIRRGELGTLLEGRAAWNSSNGPVRGHDDWLARRARSGDFMVEQAVHVWDLFHWLKGEPPIRAFGCGRRDVFAHLQPTRDVTDHYAATLEWADGFHLGFVQSWIDPADDAFTGIHQRIVGAAGGLDFGTGVATFRDRSRPRLTIHPGPQPDTRAALSTFLDAARGREPSPPPLSLAEAREATLTGLLVRRAVDSRRPVTRDEARAEG